MLNSHSDANMRKQYWHKFQAVIFFILIHIPTGFAFSEHESNSIQWHATSRSQEGTLRDQLETLGFSTVTDTPVFLRAQCPCF